MTDDALREMPVPAGPPMNEAGLRVERLGDLALLEIRRPPENFLDYELVAAIADSLEILAADRCRAVVLGSAGRHFCAGADFRHPPDRRTPHLYEAAIRLFQQPLPIVAAIQGAAVGGGLGLALAADFRVATPEARFSANFSVLGFHPGFGVSVTLPRVVGHQAALDLLYTGRRVKAAEALRIGLVDEVVPGDELRSVALARARNIAASAPLAVQSIRRTMRGDLESRVRDALVRERAEQHRLRQTADFREGLAAVTQRRPPDFGGE